LLKKVDSIKCSSGRLAPPLFLKFTMARNFNSFDGLKVEIAQIDALEKLSISNLNLVKKRSLKREI